MLYTKTAFRIFYDTMKAHPNWSVRLRAPTTTSVDSQKNTAMKPE